MGDDVGTGVDDLSDQLGFALEVRDQDLHEDRRVALLDRLDGAREVGGPVVVEVVAVHAGEDDVFETDFGHGVGDVFGLVGVKRAHPPGFDVTEVAAARAALAHQHERRGARSVPPGPALAHIWTVGLLADGVEVALAKRVLDVGELLARRRAGLQPLGLAHATHTLPSSSPGKSVRFVGSNESCRNDHYG